MTSLILATRKMDLYIYIDKYIVMINGKDEISLIEKGRGSVNPIEDG